MKEVNGNVIMPEGCETMESSDMRGIEGGRTIPYDLGQTLKGGALASAVYYKDKFNYKNINSLDLAAEIWFHAYAYYHVGPMVEILKKIGYEKITETGFWKSLSNGIDVKDGLDKEKEFGVYRYQIFRAAYAFAPAF